MQLAEFDKLCAQHDWLYAYSDDHRTWKRGRAQEDELMRLLKEHPEFQPVFSAWSNFMTAKAEGREMTREQLNEIRQQHGVQP